MVKDAVRVLTAGLLILGWCVEQGRSEAAESLAWPAATKENRPWTRWWWLGSAVDEAGLTQQLTQFREGGLGGVEICPIYGVKGYEDKHVEFLTPRWMALLEHTTLQAAKLGLGVDMTTGTGWPFGGVGVTNETASAGVVLKRYELENGERLDEQLPDVPMHYVLAVSTEGHRIDITDKVKNRQLDWEAPEGTWKIYAVGVKPRVQRVKRAAPGGEGYVVDPFSVMALNQYLAAFDKAFAEFKGMMPRGQFHDSFEYYGASWTRDFFDQFKTRRGYDLRDHLEVLFKEGDREVASRVMRDFHCTIHELHLAYLQRWTQWSHQYGGLTRNQAHGSPGNLIDLYAASDIPETEIFRSIGMRQIPMLKFSSSAAHLSGRPLVSSESFTWLTEHFQANLAQVKRATDFLFLAGVNHIFYHGIPYSPVEAPWPGWQFYASVNMGPMGGLWKDMPAYTAYVTRCQSILQTGKPANDVLLYYPIEDIWHHADEMPLKMTVHNQEQLLWPTRFHQAAMMCWEKGYLYDSISDHLLEQARFEEGAIRVGGSRYKVVVVPQCRIMPVATLEKLVSLAKDGAVILFEESLPEDVPGLHDIGARRTKLKTVLGAIAPFDSQAPPVRQREVGKGCVMVGALEAMLETAKTPREAMADQGIRIVRRTHSTGYHYFLVHTGEKPLDGWVTLGRSAKSAALLDPLFEAHSGVSAVRQNEAGQTEVYLQLQPGQSVVLRTFSDTLVEGPKWTYYSDSAAAREITGTWAVQFIEGGPELPAAYETTELASWTQRDDERTKRFAGTARYTIEFDAPSGSADDWRLEAGRVCESASITLNGKSLGTLFCEPFSISLGSALKPGKNTLSLDVTNLSANRIRDMDQRKVNWKYFYDANVVNINYKPLDASDWPLRDSGLIGPVRLVPLRRFDPMQRIDSKPTVFLIGDSTVRNRTAGQQGWGDPVASFFDTARITVENRALGGRSSRTFLTEGLWDAVLAELKAGDYVLMQFGHNDGGSLYQGRARASLKGIGEETEDVVLEATGKPETVHTYGWYLRRYIRDAKAKGATPIVLSLVPRNIWNEEKTAIGRATNSYGTWAAQAAKEEGAFFVDLNELVARHYEAVGEEKVRTVYFGVDHTHTTPTGAAATAGIVAEAIRTLETCGLREYLLPG